MSWEIHERYKHARRNKETNIFAKERALDNAIDPKYHKRLFHAGISDTLPQMKYIYWIPQGLSTVKAVIYISVMYAESTKADPTKCQN